MHFICLLPIDRVSQRLSCQLYSLYISISCLHRVFCDVSEALTLALCTLLRFIALPDCALRLELGKAEPHLHTARELHCGYTLVKLLSIGI